MIRAVIFDMYETLITMFECPIYFGTQMAEDAGIKNEDFQKIWSPAETDRSIGKITLEELLEKILKTYGCFSEEKKNMIINKRKAFKMETFNHLHPEIIPMLEGLKKNDIKIGLISNCFSEEAEIIKNSILYKYFDGVCLSYDEGIKKPDLKIYEKCMEKLNVNADECLYVGDGGSNELFAAKEIGMKPVQAVWYLKEGTNQPTKRMKEFINAEKPLDILNLTILGGHL
ncbi:MAG: HAD-IA family hydrolase [Lachnospiraceae bacterium]|nr:HAD-IA family hydrolase [Lachnospiraceae bacterium]